MALERLQLEYVDLLYAHRPDRNTPIEETVRAFNHLINTGKALYWGTSEWNPEEIAAAWRVADKLGLIGPIMEQPQYNMLVRERVEKDYVLLYEHHGLGLTPFSPLKAGILTGKYNDKIPEDSRLGSSQDKFSQGYKERYGDEGWQKEIKVVRDLKAVADKLGVDQATLAYAWVLRNPHVSSAITGASRVEQVYTAVKSLDAVEKLTPDIMKEIDDILGNKPAELTRRF
jgi:aryl-alcohol dehydrogenase-like predicted oxidoreductase